MDSVIMRFKDKYGRSDQTLSQELLAELISLESISTMKGSEYPAAIDKDCLIAFKRVKSQTI